MARVIGPNGRVTEVPEPTASSLVGNGQRGYAYAPEAVPEPEPESKPAPKRRAPRKTRETPA